MRSLILAAALVLTAAGCNKSKKEAVPAEVDVEWPDAAGFPPAVEPKTIDAGAQPESPPDDGASPAPSMSTGSGG